MDARDYEKVIDRLQEDLDELMQLVARVRDEAFPINDADEAQIDRCISSGAVGCPKSALLWIMDEIALLTKERDELRQQLEQRSCVGCDEWQQYKKEADELRAQLEREKGERAQEVEACKEAGTLEGMDAVMWQSRAEQAESALALLRQQHGNLEREANQWMQTELRLKSQLTAAQQSAKEQFVAGAGKACEVIRDHDESLDLGDYAVSILCAAIREAAKEASK